MEPKMLCYWWDCSRNAVPNMQSVKRMITVLGKMGYTHLMLYTEDTYEIEDEPYFGYKRGRFSQKELREIERFAVEHHIEVVPCIQVLGHLEAIFHWRRFDSVHDMAAVLLAEEEETYVLVEKMLRTMRGIFHSDTMFVGMDETFGLGLGEYLNRNGYHKESEIFLKHLNRVADLVKKVGYQKMIVSGDMFFRFACGQYFDGASMPEKAIEFSEEIRALVPDIASVVYWDYVGDSREKYDVMMTSIQNLTDKVVFQCAGFTWCNLTPHNRISLPRIQMAMEECKAHGIDQIIVSTWGDNGGEGVTDSIYLELMQTAACLHDWSEDEMKKRFREITGEDFDDMLALDLPNLVFGEDVNVGASNFSKNRLLNDPFLGILDKNTAQETLPMIYERYQNEKKAHPDKVPDVPGEPELFAAYAKRLHAIADQKTEHAYLYETQAYLCDALELKFDLGNRTRALYDAKDKEGLRRMATEEYNETIRRVRIFLEAFRTQWYTINKGQGFEVQDLRIGGVIARLENCRDRLLAYCDGRIDHIDELDEGVLPADRGSNFTHTWEEAVTAGRLNI